LGEARLWAFEHETSLPVATIMIVPVSSAQIQLSSTFEVNCFYVRVGATTTQVPEAVKKHAQDKAKKVVLVSQPLVKNNFGTISEPPSSAS